MKTTPEFSRVCCTFHTLSAVPRTAPSLASNLLKAAANARLLQEQELPTLGLAFLRDAARNNALSKVSRYEAAITRSLFRALHEFQRLQVTREDGQVSAPVAVDVNVDMEPTALADGG